MGFVEFMIASFVVVVLAAIGSWAVKKVPECPAIVPQLFWGVAIVIILLMLVSATGIMRRDPQIPHL